MICIVSGESSYFRLLLNKLNVKEDSVSTTGHNYRAVLNNKDILLIETGFGKVNTGCALENLVRIANITAIIDVGNCASITIHESPIESIAIANASVQYDTNYEPIKYELFQVPGVSSAIYPANQKLVTIANKSALDLEMDCSTGLMGTADRFLIDKKFAEHLKKEHNISFIDSEAGAVGQFAFMHKIPYISVKGVSNHADAEAPFLFYKNEEIASRKASKVVYNMLDVMTRTNVF